MLTMKERLSQIKTITIENINYIIQELTVQQLSGTLNIGMSALTDPEEIKKWLNSDYVEPSADPQPMD
ncbi:MAG: spore germination protein GerPC [Paenibacillaceae bacterium]